MHWLLAVSILASLSSDSLEIRFVGNAGFELFDGETTVLLDLPYQSGYSGYMEYEFEDILARGSVIAAITHRHSDHVDSGLLRGTNWSAFGPDEVLKSFPENRVLRGEQVTFGNFRLTKFATPHRDTEHYSILVEWQGNRFYFVGDTEDTSQLMAMEDLDILFVTSWLSCNVEAAKGRVDTKRTILNHQFSDLRYPPCGSAEVLQQGASIWIGSK